MNPFLKIGMATTCLMSCSLFAEVTVSSDNNPPQPPTAVNVDVYENNNEPGPVVVDPLFPLLPVWGEWGGPGWGPGWGGGYYGNEGYYNNHWNNNHWNNNHWNNGHGYHNGHGDHHGGGGGGGGHPHGGGGGGGGGGHPHGGGGGGGHPHGGGGGGGHHGH